MIGRESTKKGGEKVDFNDQGFLSLLGQPPYSEKQALIALARLLEPVLPTRQVFVSYHHARDLFWYQALSSYAQGHRLLHDHSVERRINSSKSDYVRQALRGHYITGSSCTFVLCGAETPARKFVDWEIKATLDKGHGLVGVNLPTNPLRWDGTYWVPNRLYRNWLSGYALWIQWADLLNAAPGQVKDLIETEVRRPKQQIVNWPQLKSRNGWNN